jgi:hypothetical protein
VTNKFKATGAFGSTAAAKVSLVLAASEKFTPHPTPEATVVQAASLSELSGLSITLSMTQVGVFFSASNKVITMLTSDANGSHTVIILNTILTYAFPEYQAFPSYVTLMAVGPEGGAGGGLSSGGLIGIVAGSAVGAALIIGAVIYIVRRRRQYSVGEDGQRIKKHPTKSLTNMDYSDSSGEKTATHSPADPVPLTDFGSQGTPYIFTQNVADVGGSELWL